MGQEISTYRFSERDFERFSGNLERETRALRELHAQRRLSAHLPVAGFELEAWLVDERMEPAPVNQAFLERMGEPLVTSELALFNLELNNAPEPLSGVALSLLETDIRAVWQEASATAAEVGAHLVSIGILPTLSPAQLSTAYMSPLKRYRALNEQVLRMREGRPLLLDIVGHEHLRSEHSNVMLESAATSFQIHIQTPAEQAHLYYNASLAVSAPMVACGANSPFLFGRRLWDETRIPLFEQAVEIGGFDGVARGPLHRVSFGSGYAHDSIIECFEENLEHFPVLLPMAFDETPEHFCHLRLHNGTIWRWNRPLIGFDADGTPHVRIEHRVLPGSPSILDAIANAALYYGLAQGLRMAPDELAARLPFATAKDNFYQAARFGLDAQLTWLDGRRAGVRDLLLRHLLPLAMDGLATLGIERRDADHYLEVIRMRVETGRNGCAWQVGWVREHGMDMRALTAAYLTRQGEGLPVHLWDLV